MMRTTVMRILSWISGRGNHGKSPQIDPSPARAANGNRSGLHQLMLSPSGRKPGDKLPALTPLQPATVPCGEQKVHGPPAKKARVSGRSEGEDVWPLISVIVMWNLQSPRQPAWVVIRGQTRGIVGHDNITLSPDGLY